MEIRNTADYLLNENKLLNEIIKADNEYFKLSRQLVLKKIKGPVSDSDYEILDAAFEKLTSLRSEYGKL